MSPAPGFTVALPSEAFKSHLAAVESLALIHSFRFLPSKSTMASDGGSVPVPGVTTRTCGSHTSVAFGSVIWAWRPGRAAKSSAAAGKYFLKEKTDMWKYFIVGKIGRKVVGILLTVDFWPLTFDR